MIKNNWQKPKFDVPGDRDDKIMARSADLRATTKTQALWTLGFMPDSDAAKSYKCSTKSFFWVLCDKTGKVMEKYIGFYSDPKFPEKFKKMMN